MATLRIKDFDFTTAADWTLTDSAVIVDDILTLPDEVMQLQPWAFRRWSPVIPEEPADSTEYQPAIDQLYYALDGGDPAGQLSFAQAEFGFYLKRDQLSVGPLNIYGRYDSLSGVGLRIKFYNDGEILKAAFYDENGLLEGEVTNLDAMMPINTWILVRVKLWQGRVYLKIGERGNENLIHTMNAFVDFCDPGTFALMAEGTEAHWFVDGHTDLWPYAAERLTGRADLAEAAAFVLPQYATALDSLDCLYDYTNDADGDNVTERHLYYMLHHNGAWGSWTEVDPGGDLSGVSVDGGDKIQVRLNYSNHVEYRLRPGFSCIRLAYSVEWPEVSTMHEVCQAIKDRIDADGAVAALSGWPTEGCLLAYRDDIHDVQTPIAVFIMPGTTTFDQIGEGREDDIAVAITWDWHTVTILTIATLASADPAEIITADNGLETLTNAVAESLKRTNLSGTVKQCQLEGIERDVDFGLRPGSAYSKMDSIVLNVLADGDLI